MCLDLNTLELDWVQDVLDETNCTPVRNWRTAILRIHKHQLSLRLALLYHGRHPRLENRTPSTARLSGGRNTAAIPSRTCPAACRARWPAARNKLSDLIFVPVARTPSGSEGILSAIDKASGEVVWEFKSAMYSWSSPVIVYDGNGDGFILYCTSGGYMYLLDGRSGEVLNSIDLGGNIEASAAVYGNTVVVGTRAQLIWGVQLQ
jgi:hypothetical protein